MLTSVTVRWALPLLVLFGATGVGPAEARPPLQCGATILVDTTLHADLLDCPDTGVRIGGDDITLDLNGHTIDGDARPVDSCPAGHDCDLGVDNSAGHRGLVVEGGSVQQFGIGILIAGGAVHNRLRGTRTSLNANFGIIVTQSSGTVITDNTMTRDGTSGLVVVDSPRTSIRGNTVSGSLGIAIGAFGVDDSTIRDNRLRHNDHGIVCDACTGDTISGNAISHSAGSSIDVGNAARGNRIQDNRLTDNGDGIIGTNANHNLISHNQVTGTGFFGAADTGGFGLILDGSRHNTVTDNVITGGRGPAVLVTSLDSPEPSTGNVISRNVVNSRLADGILVDNGARRNVVARNRSSRNGDDGIDVTATTVVTRNIADRNHDLGVEADPGVVDGGWNRAARNGNPAQCSGIACLG